MGLWRRTGAPLAVGVSVVVLGVWLVGHDPHDPLIPMPLCPIRLLTGLECPGCGGLRATWGVLHGDLSGALADNALVVLALPFLLIGWVLWLQAAAMKRPIKQVPRPAALGLLALAIGWMVARNLLAT